MRRILACIDLSPSSAAVARAAVELAGDGGKVVMLHVAAPDPEFVGYSTGPQSVREAVAHELRAEHRATQDLASEFTGMGPVVTGLTVQGVAVDRILEHAERESVALIVMSSRRHGLIHEALAGSVVRGVLHRARVPVVVVPPVEGQP